MSCKIYIYFLLLLCVIPLFSQNQEIHGLNFRGNSNIITRERYADFDNSTFLDLTAEKPFELTKNVSVSFNIAFWDSLSYGSIVTITDKNDFDLYIHFIKYLSKDSVYLKVLLNSQSTGIYFSLPKKEFSYINWHNISIIFNSQDNNISFLFDKENYTVKTDLGKVKFLYCKFGNDNKKETPGFVLKNILVYKNNLPAHYWKLNETGGTTAIDEIGGKRGVVNSPDWMINKHFYWEKIDSAFIPLEAAGNILFDTLSNKIINLGVDRITVYDFYSKQRTVKKYTNLKPGFLNDFVIDKKNNRIYGFFGAVHGQVTTLDLNTLEWSSIDTLKPDEGRYHYATNIFNPATNELLSLGGYGYYRAVNDLFKYNNNSKIWEKTKTNGDFFDWRRGSAASVPYNDEVLIFGGQGFPGGKQEDGVINYSDLFKLNLKTLTLKKLWKNDFRDSLFFGYSPLFVEENELFALVSKWKHKNSKSVAISRSSLVNGGYDIVSDDSIQIFSLENFSVIFAFNRIKKEFYLIKFSTTILGRTLIETYRLLYPGVSSKELASLQNVHQEYNSFQLFSSRNILGLIVAIVAISAMPIILKRVRKKKIVKNIKGLILPDDNPNSEKTEVDIPNELSYKPTDVQSPKIAINFFGGFEFYNLAGEEISALFQPKIKEFFTAIVIHTYYKNNGKNGIDYDKLNEYLWFDTVENQPGTSRKVYLSNLRKALKEFDSIKIELKNKHIFIEKDNSVEIDLEVFGALHKKYWRNIHELGNNECEILFQIAVRGDFCARCVYQWLEEIKAEINSFVIDVLIEYAERAKTSNDYAKLISITNTIFKFEPLSEEALAFSILALTKTGKPSHAQRSYEVFCREYYTQQKNEYKKDFSEFLE